MVLNFSAEPYREKAMELAKAEGVRCGGHTAEQAFQLLIQGASAGQLSNLCLELQKENPELTEAECYALTQNGRETSLLPLAKRVLAAGKPLGEALDESGRFNTSHYMGHSVLEGALCGKLAAACGLDADYAERLGLLHDYGRRAVHTLAHTVRGFELLVDVGWETEAIGCLTHSFLDGGRCASNEAAEPGFYVDAAGQPCWAPDSYQDDVALFLEAYDYTPYDRLLNIADLMATSTAVVSPSERIADIATRRTLDPTNRGYFLCLLTDALNRTRGELTKDPTVQSEHLAAADVSIEEITAAFETASEAFDRVVRGLPEG